ncbi:MAG: demethylmenaquinone methyltransferase [Candidatus Nanopelagicales bacterium]|nr:demethylmenaquinone methyltransferase [Candidatus Nanopelagicales bacterium]
MARANLDKNPADVAAMFDTVAEKYDITNDILALGQTRRWRAAVRQALGVTRGDRVLDIAAGTGTSSAAFAATGASVIPADFSLGMLRVGQRRNPGLPYIAADALALPFADNSFDAVTMSFGLRNVADRDQALREFLRVAKPGGTVVICEFSHPTFTPFRTVYTEYLMAALPFLADRVASNPEAYRYLAESIRAWPSQAELAGDMSAAGWERVQWRNFTGGIVALHRGLKPAS